MPKALLTDAKIKGLKAAPGVRSEFGDTVVDGLRIRVSGRAKVWALRVRANGKVRTFTLGSFGDQQGELGLAAARAEAIRLKDGIGQGILPQPAVARSKSPQDNVRAMVDRFMCEYAVDRQVKRPEAYRWQFDKYILPRIGSREIRAISRAELREVVQQVRADHGLTTARRVGGLIKRFFAWMASEDILDSDPAAPMKLPGVEVQRERTLTDEELRALWRATDTANKPHERNKAGRVKPHPSDYPWGAYFRLLLLLGQRRSEVARMRWSAVDLEAATWALKAAEVKSARAHLIPLPEAAVELLRSLPRVSYLDAGGNEQPSEWVLTTNGRAPIADFSKPKGWLDAAMREEIPELPHWVVHDLRRTVSTNLARLGIDPFIRRRVLNHALTGVDAIYDRHDYLEPKRRALSAWAEDLLRIVGEGAGRDNVVALHG
jgi:integrase